MLPRKILAISGIILIRNQRRRCKAGPVQAVAKWHRLVGKEQLTPWRTLGMKGRPQNHQGLIVTMNGADARSIGLFVTQPYRQRRSGTPADGAGRGARIQYGDHDSGGVFIADPGEQAFQYRSATQVQRGAIRRTPQANAGTARRAVRAQGQQAGLVAVEAGGGKA